MAIHEMQITLRQKGIEEIVREHLAKNGLRPKGQPRWSYDAGDAREPGAGASVQIDVEPIPPPAQVGDPYR